MASFLELPIAIFSIEHTFYTFPSIFGEDLNNLVGIPKLPENQRGQCFQVCGNKGCDFLHAVESPNQALTLTEKVARDILKSDDDFNVDTAYLLPEPVEKASCEESKTLKKRNFYDSSQRYPEPLYGPLAYGFPPPPPPSYPPPYRAPASQFPPYPPPRSPSRYAPPPQAQAPYPPPPPLRSPSRYAPPPQNSVPYPPPSPPRSPSRYAPPPQDSAPYPPPPPPRSPSRYALPPQDSVPYPPRSPFRSAPSPQGPAPYPPPPRSPPSRSAPPSQSPAPFPPLPPSRSPQSKNSPPRTPPPRAPPPPVSQNRNIKIQNENTGNGSNKPEKVTIVNSQNQPARQSEKLPKGDNEEASPRQSGKQLASNHQASSAPSATPPKTDLPVPPASQAAHTIPARQGAPPHPLPPPAPSPLPPHKELPPPLSPTHQASPPTPAPPLTSESPEPPPRLRRRPKGRTIRVPFDLVEDPIDPTGAQVEAVGIGISVTQPQAGDHGEPVRGPKIKKIERPDGSVEYSFEITSGEVELYNEGDPVKRFPGERKGTIFGLKKSLGMDGDDDEMGWFRSLGKRSFGKRAIIPDNKPTARNYPPPPPQPVPAYQRKLNNKFGYPQYAQQPPQSQRKQPEQVQQKLGPSEEEIQAQLQKQQQAESDRVRRHSLKTFYRQMADHSNNFEIERDKEMESRIKEESDRIAAELVANPQYLQQQEPPQQLATLGSTSGQTANDKMNQTKG